MHNLTDRDRQIVDELTQALEFIRHCNGLLKSINTPGKYTRENIIMDVNRSEKLLDAVDRLTIVLNSLSTID